MNNKFAGFWQRFLMFIVDLVIMVILFTISSKIMGLDFISAMDRISSSGLSNFIAILISAVYIIGFWAILGATPGKLMFKARIVDAKTGNKASIGKLILRYICYLVSKILVGFGFIWIGLDSRKQSWHDKVAGTVVVKKEKDVQKAEIIRPSDKDNSRWKTGRILFVISIILCLGLIVIINVDVPLDPGSKAWLSEMDYVEENPLDNGFYQFIAMGIPEDQDAHQFGYDFIQEEKEQILANKINHEKMQHKIINEDITPDIKHLIDQFQAEEMLDYCKQNKTEIAALYNKYSFREKRYYEALDKPEFQITSFPHHASSVGELMLCVNSNLINDFQVVATYLAGDSDGAFKQLNTSMHYDRILAEKAGNLITKLVTMVLISRDFKTIDHLIEASNGSYSIIRDYVLNINPITISERDLTKASKREFFHSSNQLLTSLSSKEFQPLNSENLDEKLAKALKPFFKPKQTINMDYQQKKVLAELSKMSGKDFNTNYLLPSVSPSTFDTIFNPVGSILATIAAPIYNSYIGKFHYIDGYLNMLKLKVMILDEGIASEDIPAFLEKQADTLYSPFSEEAISWDAERSMLYLDGPYDTENDILRELKVNLWR